MKTYYEDANLTINDDFVCYKEGLETKIIPTKAISYIEVVREKVKWWIVVLLLIIGVAGIIFVGDDGPGILCLIPGIIVLIYDIIESSKRSIYIYSNSRNYISIKLGIKNKDNGDYPIVKAILDVIKTKEIANDKIETTNKE